MTSQPLPLYEEILLLALDDPILDECLALVTDAKKPKKARDWVMKFVGLKDLKNRAARQLVVKGVLTEETGSVLKIFKRTIYPEVDGGPEKDLRERMKKAIFTSTTELEARTAIIVTLAQAAILVCAVMPAIITAAT